MIHEVEFPVKEEEIKPILQLNMLQDISKKEGFLVESMILSL